VKNWDYRRVEPAGDANNSLLYGGEMVTHTGQEQLLRRVDGRRRRQDSISRALRTGVRFPPPPPRSISEIESYLPVTEK
jgi:hypothetical protein